MQAALAARQQGIAVAWDKQNGTKCFGIYPSPEAFYRSLLANPPNERWGYELIQRDLPCHGYLDMEWYSQKHQRLKMILATLREKIKEEHHLTAEL